MELPVDYTKLSQPERRMVREEYIRIQSGLCLHCKKPLCDNPSDEIMETEISLHLFPPNFLKYPVHLHHSHQTGLTIGAVHARCNAVLFQYHGE